MRAVNLVPTDEQRGAGSGIASYALLGVLGLALLASVMYVLTGNQVAEGKVALAAAKQKNSAAQAQLAALKPYVDFAKLEQSRVQTVRSLASSRFDWVQVMHDLSRVTTKAIWLQSLTGTVAPGVTLGEGAGGGSSFRADEPNPALELEGCGISNKAVVAFTARLRAMRGVQQVLLSDATKNDTATPKQPSDSTAAAPGAPAAADTGGCTTSDQWPDFHVVVFYAPLPAGSVIPGATPATPSSTASTPASGGSSSTSSTSSSSTTTPATPTSTTTTTTSTSATPPATSSAPATSSTASGTP